MSPEIFALWAPDAPIHEVLQVCHEARFADDPIVRALVGLLESEIVASRVYEDVRDVVLPSLNAIIDEDQVSRLREQATEHEKRGVHRLAEEVEEFLSLLNGGQRVCEIRGAVYKIADGLCESRILNPGAIARKAAELKVGPPRVVTRRITRGMWTTEFDEHSGEPQKPPRGRYQKAILDELRHPSSSFRSSALCDGLSRKDLVDRVNKKLGMKPGSRAVYNALNELEKKGKIEIDSEGVVRLK